MSGDRNGHPSPYPGAPRWRLHPLQVVGVLAFIQQVAATTIDGWEVSPIIVPAALAFATGRDGLAFARAVFGRGS